MSDVSPKKKIPRDCFGHLKFWSDAIRLVSFARDRRWAGTNAASEVTSALQKRFVDPLLRRSARAGSLLPRRGSVCSSGSSRDIRIGRAGESGLRHTGGRDSRKRDGRSDFSLSGELGLRKQSRSAGGG